MKKLTISILLLPLILFYASCCSSNNNNITENGRINKVIADDLKKTMRAVNDTIRIKCIVIGWKGSQCKFAENAASQVTRSDWLVKWDGECYYVTGGMPAFIQLFDNSAFGKNILLKAVIRKDKEEKIYLEYLDGQEISAN